MILFPWITFIVGVVLLIVFAFIARVYSKRQKIDERELEITRADLLESLEGLRSPRQQQGSTDPFAQYGLAGARRQGTPVFVTPETSRTRRQLPNEAGINPSR
jgi:hypothetical protein